MKPLKTIAGYNLLIMFVYSILFRLASGGDQTSILILSAVAIGLHVIVSLIISAMHASDARKEKARAWLLSALIVLLVGFSTCLGNAAL